MPSASDEVRAWLDAFARCVRERDLESGRALFVKDVRSFGTVARRVDGIEALIEQQWRPVWNETRDFSFAMEDLTVSLSPDQQLAGVAVQWHSEGISSKGERFPRSGRATLLLRAESAGWRAVHSHFSMNPSSR